MPTITDSNADCNTIDVVAGYETPGQGWNSRQVRQRIQKDYYTWLSQAADWRHFLTLTLEYDRPADVVHCYFKRLVQVLNREVFGGHYTHLVGHSYFNYVVGMERQTRGVLHLHVLADRPLHYQLIHKWWGHACGFALIEQVKNQEEALRYVTKYVCKGGDENVDVYLQAPDRKPRELPAWWLLAIGAV